MSYRESKELCDYIDRCLALDIPISIENMICELIDGRLVVKDINFNGLESFIESETMTYRFPDYLDVLEISSECQKRFCEFLTKNYIIVLDYNMIEEVNSKYSLNLSRYGDSFDSFCLKIIYANHCKKIPTIGIENYVKKLYVNSLDNLTCPICYKELEYVEANGLERLTSYAFHNIESLKEVHLKNCVFLGSYAFKGCTSLERVFAPNVKMTTNAFNGCRNLKELDLSSLRSLDKESFTDCFDLETIKLDSCTFIGFNSFTNCNKLVSLSFPSLKEISRTAFSSCENLYELYMPNLKEFSFDSLFKCYALRKVTIGENTKIRSNSKNISRSFVVKIIRETSGVKN